MKGDISDNKYDGTQQASGVRFQQGRVLLDSELNLLQDIQAGLLGVANAQTVGAFGTFVAGSGFGLAVTGASPQKVAVSAGRIHLGGLLLENEQELDLDQQVDAPNVTLPSGLAHYLVYVRAWEQHRTYLQDETLLDPALDVDTTSRSRVVWQADLVELTTGGPPFACYGSYPEVDQVTSIPTGEMEAQITSNPDPTLGSGEDQYRGNENRVYRVEIHKGGLDAVATYKWSRDNGSVAAAWTGQPSEHTAAAANFEVTIGMQAHPRRAFAVGDYVELTSDRESLHRIPGRMCTVTDVSGSQLTLKLVADEISLGVVDYATFGASPVVRMWDGVGNVTDATSGFAELGTERIEVKFTSARTYQTNDWWLIPAHSETGTIHWKPGAQSRHGPLEHIARLGIVERQVGDSWVVHEDCRKVFPRAPDMTRLHFVAGASQGGPPGVELPRPLQVAVTQGHFPFVGTNVKFKAVGGGHGTLSPNSGGSFQSEQTVTTDADGVATVYWKLGDDGQQEVSACLLDEQGNESGAPILFDAQLDPEFWLESADVTSFSPSTVNLKIDSSNVLSTFNVGITSPGPAWTIQALVGTTHQNLKWYDGNIEVAFQPFHSATGLFDWRTLQGTVSFTLQSGSPNGVDKWLIQFTPTADARATVLTHASNNAAQLNRVRVRIQVNEDEQPGAADPDAYDLVWRVGYVEFTFWFRD